MGANGQKWEFSYRVMPAAPEPRKRCPPSSSSSSAPYPCSKVV
ncbi:hypothetical protein CORC01_11880 [Colletotrichum orchidophilum]|uniref:Uncharacterized protein n=1 Tax=Colletotrichum orchidophilum TaxID=1209926 RepID=A0A1G4AUS0_9PEZI|nr:uncharacterized protein CORC01_11880 [Colletotrichum orchidophilum]OHE92802.1 hypothetical protein CORC01_11880 [Colletotrichum orchidophilum]